MATLSIRTSPDAGKPLYAIPDYEAALAILPNGFRAHLTRSVAGERIRANSGLVPVAIDPDPRGDARVFWADLGRHPYRESKHLYTLRVLAERNGVGETFTTDLSILDDDSLFEDGLDPAGLIFHISRCGSTLTTKALARAAGNVMISQGGPLQRGFWANATDEWRRPPSADPRTLPRLRNLVRAMTRRRRGGEERAFIKFISWNVLYIDLIAAAFPHSPALFLYRDPAQVIATVKQETTAALLARGTRQATFLTGLPEVTTERMSDAEYLATCFAQYFKCVLDSETEIACVNYKDLGPENFQRIIEAGLGYQASQSDLAAMREQFAYDSKDDTASPRPYSPAQEASPSHLSPDEHAAIDLRCSALLAELGSSERNLFAGSPQPGQKTVEPQSA